MNNSFIIKLDTYLSNPTDKTAEDLIILNCDFINYIKNEHLTLKLYNLALRYDGIALKYIPKNLQTPEICEKAILQNPMAIHYVADNLYTEFSCKLAIRKGLNLHEIRSDKITHNLCKIAIQQKPSELHNILTKFI
jgi:hypothetical protein